MLKYVVIYIVLLNVAGVIREGMGLYSSPQCLSCALPMVAQAEKPVEQWFGRFRMILTTELDKL